MSTCATIALISMVVGEYTGVLFPILANHQQAVALIVTLFFALLHWRGVLWGSRTQNVTSLIKVLAFTAFAIIALIYPVGNTPPPAGHILRGGGRTSRDLFPAPTARSWIVRERNNRRK